MLGFKAFCPYENGEDRIPGLNKRTVELQQTIKKL
jgi:hypothetical protein